jgi:hypothetical protein
MAAVLFDSLHRLSSSAVLLVFVAESAFCRRSRYWRQKSQVASLLELVSNSTGDGIRDRKNERSIQARVDHPRRSVASAGWAGKYDDKSPPFVAKLEFCRETHFWRQNTQIVSSLGVAVDVSDDNLSPRSFVAMTFVASRDFDDTNISPLSVA